jgi:PAS domain S-box-containing protein/diguanylate cyclase (GGDEF)-like protein
MPIVSTADDKHMFDSAFKYASIGMSLARTNGQFIKVNASYCTMLDYSESELTKLDFQTITHPDDLDQDLAYVNELLSSQRNTYSMEKRFIDKHGRIIWVLMSVSLVHDSGGSPKFFIAQLQDIMARKQAEKKLQLLATTEPLTGLPNRYHVLKLINEKLALKQTFFVARLCIKNFPSIQDNYGYSFSDRLMRELASALNKHTSLSSTIGVLGRGEFIILLNNINTLGHAELHVTAIATAIATMTINRITLNISICSGISGLSTHTTLAEKLITQADLALHYAKKQQQQCLTFNTQLETLLATEVKIEHALPTAIANKEISCHYQAIVNHCGKIIGFESLARWTHQQFGVIAPNQFVGIAEECGLMHQLGDHLLHSTLHDIHALKQHIDISHYYFSINLSALQLSDNTFAEKIQLALAKYDIPGQCLVFEITETALLADIHIANGIVEKLHALGIHIALDDFGTGHSNLAILTRMKAHHLKIDISFVRHINQHENNRMIVMSIVHLADLLNMIVIAEGIENKAEFDCLKKLGNMHYQGYYFHKPLPLSAIVTLMATQST